jgi:hypothetical protein
MIKRGVLFVLLVVVLVGFVSAATFEGTFYKIIITNEIIDEEIIFQLEEGSRVYDLDTNNLGKNSYSLLNSYNSGDTIKIEGRKSGGKIIVDRISPTRVSRAAVVREANGASRTRGVKKIAVVNINTEHEFDFEPDNFEEFYKSNFDKRSNEIDGRGVDQIYYEDSYNNVKLCFEYYDLFIEGASTSAGVLLQEFRNARNTCTGVNEENMGLCDEYYDLYTGITGLNLDGATVGIAYIDVVGYPSVAYSVSQDLASKKLMPVLLAHELGHNFGMNHDPTGSSPRYIMYESLGISNLHTFSDISRLRADWIDNNKYRISDVCPIEFNIENLPDYYISVVGPEEILYNNEEIVVDMTIRGKLPPAERDCPNIPDARSGQGGSGGIPFAPCLDIGIPGVRILSPNDPKANGEVTWNVDRGSCENNEVCDYNAKVLFPKNLFDSFEREVISEVPSLTFYRDVLRRDIPPTEIVGCIDPESDKCAETLSIKVKRADPYIIRGDSNGDGIVDVSDAVKIMQYLFLGENLQCLGAGEINGDGVIDLSDSLYLLNWLFLGGPEPFKFNAQCEEKHSECQSNQCIEVFGFGVDDCSTEKDCIKGTCSDSDGGRVYNVKGTTTGRRSIFSDNVQDWEDFCATSFTGEIVLVEYYCNPINERVSAELVRCNCADGACVTG